MKDKGLRLVKYGLCILGMIMFSFLAGCAKEEKDLLEKIKDLEFTVLAEDNIPEELKTIIEEKRENTFKVTYQDNGFLYICIFIESRIHSEIRC